MSFAFYMKYIMVTFLQLLMLVILCLGLAGAIEAHRCLANCSSFNHVMITRYVVVKSQLGTTSYDAISGLKLPETSSLQSSFSPASGPSLQSFAIICNHFKM